MAEQRELKYEGKAKKVYATEDPGVLWVEYKDDATAGNGQKRGTIVDKGRLNAAITARLLRLLEQNGIATHLLAEPQDRVHLCRSLQMLPVEVVVRNVIAGSLAKRLGQEEGEQLSQPIVELYYKNDELGDPLVNEDHLRYLGVAQQADVLEVRRLALAINEVLRPFLKEQGLLLVDFKLEFGKDEAGRILLGDEISPDTCRFWDAKTGEKLDKDRFRRDLGQVEEAYQEVFRRLIRHAV